MIDVAAMLEHDEGFRTKPYRDSVGKLTVGIGRNLDDKGISLAEARVLLDNDIAECVRDLSAYSFWANASPERQAALINFRFQLGLAGFRGFKRSIAFLASGDWASAADEMLRSKWAEQVPARAKRVTDLLR